MAATNVMDDLREAGRQIVAAGLARGAGGNLSGRQGQAVLITRCGAGLGRLEPADFVLLDPAQLPDAPTTLSPRPSSEASLHLAAYQARPEAGATLHAHPPRAISLGLLGRSLPALTPDFYLHLGPLVPLVPYLTPTSAGLAAAAATALEDSPAVLLQNHGVVVTGRDVTQALLRLFLLEEHAGIYLHALVAGPPRPLSAEEMRRLDEATGGRYKLHR